MTQPSNKRFLLESDKGVANGLATLDTGAKIPAAQIPDAVKPDNLGKPVGKGELFLHVTDYGAKFDGTTDDTAAIQSALNAAANTGTAKTSVVLMPRGTAMISSLTMPEKVTLRGSGKASTVLQVISGGTAVGALNIAAGYSDNIFFEDFQLRGAGALNPGQHGLYAEARGDGSTPDTGGWGNGGARRILVSNFTGNQLWLRGKGGGTTPYHQHQFLTFELCDFSARDLSNSMLMSGKNGQITFTNCQFSYGGGSSTQAGTNLRIVREVADDGVTNVSDGYAYAITFVNCSVEGRANGVQIERAETIVFIGTFFERLGKAFTASLATRNVVLYATQFADAGVDGSGTGYLVRALSANSVLVSGANIAGSADKTFVDFVRVMGVINNGSALTSNMTLNTDPSANTLDIQSAATVTTRGTLNTITTKYHFPGDVLYLRAWGGSITLNSGGNITYSGLTAPVTIPDGRVATLVRIDQGASAAWQLTAVSAPTGVEATRTVTASTTATFTDSVIVSSGANLTITLPDPTTVSAGKMIRVKNIDATAATVATAGAGKLIDSAATQTLAQWASGRYTSDGIRWLTM